MAGRARRKLRQSAVVREPLAAPSARQVEILQLIAHGGSNKEIARRLGLTEGTVKQHLYALYRKLGVRNRTQALRAGARWLEPAAAVESVRATMFARRLVTAVVMLPHPDAAGSAADVARVQVRLAESRSRLEAFARAFDATPEQISGGGIAAWFGQPFAHGDDVDRAIAFVRALRGAGLDEAPIAWTVGVASAAEVLGEDGDGATAYRSLRTATLLATLAPPLAPLACGLTAQFALGLASVQADAALPAGAVPVAHPAAPSAAVSHQWGGLPFCGELVAAARRRRCQWVAVCSWPPEAGTRLLTAIGEFLAAHGVRVRVLWAPAHRRGADIARSLLLQIDPRFPQAAEASPGTLAEALHRLAGGRVTLLVVQGLDGLETFKGALGEDGLARLRDAPLVVAAGAMQRGEGAQTTVRILGDSALETPIVRVLRMQVPSVPGRPDLGVRTDVQALLDRVSAGARQVARAASRSKHATLNAVARLLAISVEEVRERGRELGRHGVLRVEGDKLVFRDAITAEAVRASLT